MLLWLARLPIKRTHHDLMRMEDRLKYLIGASVVTAGFEPGKARIGAHRGGRVQEGAWLAFILRSALPKRRAFRWNRLARIKHVAANLDHYIKRFMKRLARGLLMRRCAARGTAPMALISHAPACVHAFADTS